MYIYYDCDEKCYDVDDLDGADVNTNFMEVGKNDLLHLSLVVFMRIGLLDRSDNSICEARG